MPRSKPYFNDARAEVIESGLPTVLATLREGARAWWAHDTEAKVRASVRRSVESWRSCFAVVNAPAGVTMYHRDGSTTTGGNARRTLLVAARLGIPVIGLGKLSDSQIMQLPMLAPDDRADAAPWHSMSYAPLRHYAAMVAYLGGNVLNFEITATGKEVVAEMTQTPDHLVRGLRAFTEGDEMGVYRCMVEDRKQSAR